MATVRNVSTGPLSLTGGRTLPVGQEADVNPDTPHEAALVASGKLKVVDPDGPVPPVPPDPTFVIVDITEAADGEVVVRDESSEFGWSTSGSVGGGGSVPDGGSTGEVLTKLSSTDGDADWQPASGVDPADFADGQVAVYDADLAKLVGGQVLNPLTRLKTFALTGDSITENNNGPVQNLHGGDYDAAYYGGGYNTRGWFHWANAYLGGRLRLVASFGVGSQSAVQIAARFDDDVLALNPLPDAVIIGGGTNDLRYGGGNPTTAANALIEMAEKVLAVGKQPILMSVPPFNADVVTCNDLLRDYVKTKPVLLCDSYDALVGGDGFFAPEYDNDPDPGGTQHVHPNGEGARVIGRTLADLLATVTAADDSILITDAADPLNLVLNPFLTGDTGDGVPTSWNNGGLGSGITRSKVARTDGFGEWVQFAFPPAGTTLVEGAIQQVSEVLDAKVVAGRPYRFAVEVEGEDWDGCTEVGFALQFVAPSGRSSTSFNNTFSNSAIGTPGERLVIQTPPITAPASLDYLYLVIHVKAKQGTFRFGRVCMYEVETRYPFAKRIR